MIGVQQPNSPLRASAREVKRQRLFGDRQHEKLRPKQIFVGTGRDDLVATVHLAGMRSGLQGRGRASREFTCACRVPG